MGYFANARPADGDGYINGLADIFVEYPIGIVEECCNITRGIARSCGNFLPSPQQVIEWCDVRLGAARYIIRKGPPKLEVVYSEEHRASMRERLKTLVHGLFDTKPADPKPYTPPSDAELRAHYQPQHQEAAE